MEQKDGLKEKMNRKVDRRLGWGIMGGVLIIVFTLAVVCACAAVDNKDGITAMIVIGCIAFALLILPVVVYYLRNRKQVEQAIEPAEEGQPIATANSDTADMLYTVRGQQYTGAQLAAMVESLLPVDACEQAAEAADASEQDVVAPVVEEEAPDEVTTAVEDAASEVAADEADVPVEAEQEVESEAQEPAQQAVVAPEPEQVAEPEVPEQPPVSVEEAHVAMSDEQALAQVQRSTRASINGPLCNIDVAVLSANFVAGDTITIDVLRAKGLVSRKEIGYIVLAGGSINKPLTVIANDFSADAVKMILLAGGKAIGC